MTRGQKSFVLPYGQGEGRTTRGQKGLMFFAVIAGPLLCLAILGILSGPPYGMPELTFNAVIMAIPQLICFAFWVPGRLSMASFLGGLVSADALIAAASIDAFATRDHENLGVWILYFLACIPLVPLGILSGKLAGHFLRRQT